MSPCTRFLSPSYNPLYFANLLSLIHVNVETADYLIFHLVSGGFAGFWGLWTGALVVGIGVVVWWAVYMTGPGIS